MLRQSCRLMAHISACAPQHGAPWAKHYLFVSNMPRLRDAACICHPRRCPHPNPGCQYYADGTAVTKHTAEYPESVALDVARSFALYMPNNGSGVPAKLKAWSGAVSKGRRAMLEAKAPVDDRYIPDGGGRHRTAYWGHPTRSIISQAMSLRNSDMPG